ncbi:MULTISPECIES: cell envelope integrity protein TolA [unclassified Undibacterium]|uniref:cell envelope integrity protein TolA n=1 Tax=unclassified Undibacterium TaxID=2630295 RepID=UPI002AC9A2F7|nr:MULTISPECIES: cell envelope integrity protein TolA [unclassified Undibacterium]MEB0140030.1 cell envelope integrity protein TolA [Undibacterium sp. CCC2.1]MEB0173057.1 cell envelope integrity protein TolA [Undibacterium sp. CCC1.1]MEB0176869.1 cell envelope integrity protein TolA [Undibacterium sp. CCC3.4]MEB0216101.1 cell envelope integrity protein TolA [Undibacterium sp. 5I2]WPX42016.1 cell envelope integrity protein TolA [Undibacterium sp. CCC3.4]
MIQTPSPHYDDFSRQKTGQWRAPVLAALVHLFLILFLWIGIHWQNEQSVAVEAEVWDLTTREAAAPLAEPPPPPPPTPVEREIVAAPRPPEPVLEDPEIALQQEKQKLNLAKQKKLALEREQAREQERKQEQRAADLLAQEKELQKRDKERALQAKKDNDKQKVQDKERQDQASKQQLAKDQAARDKAFKENMSRLNAQAGVSAAGGNGSNGTAAKSTGNNRGDPSYGATIAAKIRANTIYNVPDMVAGNPAVDYHIELLPDGSLRGPIRKLKSSGIPGFDEAVAKGIEKSQPFPKDKSGNAAVNLDLHYKMKEE